jgi:hypothetical protein
MIVAEQIQFINREDVVSASGATGVPVAAR